MANDVGSSRDEFFARVMAAFGEAERVSGHTITRDYRIGGYLVRVRFAGPALVPLITPAFEHLAVPPDAGNPSLTICLWESTSSGVYAPAPKQSEGGYGFLTELRDYTDELLPAAFSPRTGVLSLLDNRLSRAVYWVSDGRRLANSPDLGLPLLTILNWWMRRRGLHLTHAAAVGRPLGGVLLAGKSGSGKSTTALACLNSDLRYVGDDCCLISSHPVPYVHSLYGYGKLDAFSLRMLPGVAPLRAAGRFDTGKALLFVHERHPEKVTTGFPIQAVVLPCITGRQEPTLVPVSPAAGMKALAPSTIFQLPGTGHVAFHEIAKLVKRVPCFRLELGPEIGLVPALLTRLLDNG